MDLRLLAVALAFAAMGALALVRPATIGRFFDVRIESVGGRNEVRAVYGGFGLAMATALCLAMNRPELRAGVVACTALALAGMATGRLVSAALERPGAWPWFFCALETAGAALLASTLR